MPSKIAHPLRVSLVIVGVLVLSSCSHSSNSSPSRSGPSSTAQAPALNASEPKAYPSNSPAFYTLPSPIPSGTHGHLIRYQQVLSAPKGLLWYRIMYISTTVSGERTIETGVLTIPDKPAPTTGWKLATHAHGSTGLGYDCAPSMNLAKGGMLTAELQVVGQDAAKSNYVVASADYEGQGGMGRHPFLEGESEGRSVLDAARAAREFPGLKLPTTLAIVGYSQGGHAALWANQIASKWTPEFHVLGTLAGAPASEVGPLIASSAPDILNNSEALGILGGLVAANPKLQGDLDKILAPAGKALLTASQKSCTLPAGFTVGSPLLNADPLKTEPWEQLFKANTPGGVKTPDPVLIIHSAQDESVPIGQSEMLLQRMCSVGQMVERRVIPTGGHVGTAVPAYAQGFTWLDGLSAGKKPISSCTS